MKKMFPFLLLALLVVIQANSAELAKNDTTFRYQGKFIQVEDSVGKVKVKVFESDANKDSVAYKQLYEGIYTDGKSYEKWTVVEELGLQLPFTNLQLPFTHKASAKGRFSKIKDCYRKSGMEPHWAGIGLGYANISNSRFDLNTIDGVSVKTEQSNQWSFNIFEGILPLYRNNLGLTTGLGFSWTRFYLDENKHFLEKNGVTGIYDAPPGINYEYNKLRIVQMNIPLLLEWQPTFGSKYSLFVSAGVVGGINIGTSSTVRFIDANVNGNGDVLTEVIHRGLNTAPLSLDYMAQFGYRKLSVYAKYSPFSIFQPGKGPNVRAVSLGMMLQF
jgi:hypothetical protein